jgi:integrase
MNLIYTELENDIEKYIKKRKDTVSDRTLKNQVTLLNNYAKFLTKNKIKNFKKVKENNIRDFLDLKLTGATKEAYRIVIRLFYNKMYDKRSLIDKIEKIKNDSKHKIQTLDDIITPKDIEEVFRKPMQYPIRDKAVLLSLWESNARAGEFLDLKVKDIKFKNGITTFKLTCEKRRDNILIREIDCELCTPYLRDWLKIGHPQPNNPEAPLWVALGKGKRGKPLGYMGLYYICKAAFNKSPHHLRHSRSTYLALNGASEIQLMGHGGWSHPTMVYHYSKMASRRAGKSIGIKNGNGEADIIKDMEAEFKDVSDWQKQQMEYNEMKQRMERLEEAILQLTENPDIKKAIVEMMKNK